MKFKKLCDIILMGDFNARKGNLQDQFELNSVFANLGNTDRDLLKTNKFGRSLAEILSSNGLICLNGRTKGDPSGNFTYFTPKVNSVHYIFIISQLWLTSHPRSTVVLLETGTLGTSREIYSKDDDSEELSLSSWCIASLSFPAIAFELVSSMARALGL